MEKQLTVVVLTMDVLFLVFSCSCFSLFHVCEGEKVNESPEANPAVFQLLGKQRASSRRAIQQPLTLLEKRLAYFPTWQPRKLKLKRASRRRNTWSRLASSFTIHVFPGCGAFSKTRQSAREWKAPNRRDLWHEGLQPIT